MRSGVTAALVFPAKPNPSDGRPNGNNAAAGCTGDDDGAGEFGVRAGYDWQTSSGWVVGLVGEWTSTSAEDAVSGFSTTPASYTFQREVTSVAAARVRQAGDLTAPTVSSPLARFAARRPRAMPVPPPAPPTP